MWDVPTQEIPDDEEKIVRMSLLCFVECFNPLCTNNEPLAH
jgi:hypothetical protein